MCVCGLNKESATLKIKISLILKSRRSKADFHIGLYQKKSTHAHIVQHLILGNDFFVQNAIKNLAFSIQSFSTSRLSVNLMLIKFLLKRIVYYQDPKRYYMENYFFYSCSVLFFHCFFIVDRQKRQEAKRQNGN